jgi:broad specificity phosphatase PhoE
MIIAVRHLPTKFNKIKVLQGSIDNPIETTEEDFSMIENNKKILSNFKIDEVYSSPLLRAKQTAKLYGFDNPIIDPSISEFNFGIFENMERDLFVEKNSEWDNNFNEVKIGEGFENFTKRLDSFINSLSSNKTYLLFTHGVVIRYLILKSLNVPYNFTNRLDIKNNSLNFIKIL